ncbi:MAG: copper resistance protein B [Novosphingobium sp.]
MRALAFLLALTALPAAAQEMDHSQHGESQAVAGSDAEVGSETAPPVATDYAADRVFPADRMEPSRAALLDEGRFNTSTLKIDRLEYRAMDGRDGYAWEAEAWTGGDIDRFVLATNGEGEFGHKPETFEASALWRRAITPYFNLELGARHDFRPSPQRTYAVAGISGLAPYWIEVQGHLMISNKGDVHARIEAEHDMRLTQKLILQPAVEINIAMQDVPDLKIGGGVEKIELGARLRYQVNRKLAPYLGVHWERKLGGTADFAQAEGERVSGVSLLFGIRTWF